MADGCLCRCHSRNGAGTLDRPVAPHSTCERYIHNAGACSSRRLSAGDLAVSMQIDAPLVLWRKGVDAAFFHPSKRSAALRERWRVSDERPAILYAGSLSDRETFRHLVSLEAALRRSQPIHRLIVAGDGPILHDLQAKCPSAVFTGALTPVELAEALASSDLFVMPGDEDGAAAVLQAQACGLPVVVMEQRCASEYASDHGSLRCRALTDFLVDTAALIRNPRLDIRR